MARSLLHTFSDSKHFEDRRGKAYAQPITERINPHSRPIVSYYFPKGVGEFHYGERHPMKPHRLSLTNALVLGYGLDKQIHHLYDPRPATREELEVYHDSDYIAFLNRVTPSNQNELKYLVDSFNCVEDCPVFADMYEFCRMYAGGSLAGARKLCAGTTDIAINWSGGLHHAKRGEASGFCYVNDIVLAILELLRYHPRVLYIDIDIHHGDGVELAFWNSNRVMTVSFHKYTGDFFPGTGRLEDNGGGLGKHFALNVPLLDGIDDESYLTVFKTIISDTVASFRPSSIVLQCGADSLGCDRLGAFNLSIAGHGECVNYVRKFNVPLLVVGGGGYTVHNVSRCWTYETSVLVGAAVPDELPCTIYDAWFAADGYTLHPTIVGKIENQNTPESLRRVTTSIRMKLRYLQGAPSVQMQEIPPNLAGWLEEEERTPEEHAEARGAVAAGEFRQELGKALNEFFDSETDVDKDEDPTSARGKASAPTPAARRGRAATRGRARGRTSAAAGAAAVAPSGTGTPIDAHTTMDNDTEERTPAPAIMTPRSTRGRGRGVRARRGRRSRVPTQSQTPVQAEMPTKEPELDGEKEKDDEPDVEREVQVMAEKDLEGGGGTQEETEKEIDAMQVDADKAEGPTLRVDGDRESEWAGLSGIKETLS